MVSEEFGIGEKQFATYSNLEVRARQLVHIPAAAAH
jgi:hypothetical protein